MDKKLQEKPKFRRSQDINHLRRLSKRIHDEIKPDHPKGLFWIQIKSVTLILLYISLFAFAQTVANNTALYLFIFFVLGLLMVFIFLNIIHEVSHDNIFKSKKLNRLFLYFFDILGVNSYIWKLRHRIMHHNYPNINGWDTDIEQSPLFKIYPDAPHSKPHDYQHILMFLLYPTYVFNWLIVRDFKDFFKTDSMIKKAVIIPKIEYFKLFSFKFFYLFYMFIIPVFVFSIPFSQVFLGFFILTLTASIFSLIILLPPHANIDNEFPELPSDLNMPSSWLEHQLKTTSDINTNNWITRNLMANFNFHVAHHIVPNLSNIYLGKATKVIKDYAKENNLPYKSHSMWKALNNHYQLVKRNALTKTAILEETF
ncbi:MAG: hypothetical protein BM564_05805 [Bacteroidetes bacterium MedPE-SWsnd-G2]|nr:MAG: hypothetical protein BM564_05805 [Bacteroidetes bacterium MedPE-SWsnd-G2]